ncbi:hypothetical protein SBA5_370041 [Candidatus Sulfotelmatomonas gaucii]|uniref:Uncharacterized protein n=1 Tax=Candidatus Sulfuritelmatomonas gaucii TaxID=2043161 RepID=A0A2N9LIF9_9BACT|nr:hypothetical protein SBA5_370041 [Candidatus Sulfotelmatomonas gaucii]
MAVHERPVFDGMKHPQLLTGSRVRLGAGAPILNPLIHRIRRRRHHVERIEVSVRGRT